VFNYVTPSVTERPRYSGVEDKRGEGLLRKTSTSAVIHVGIGGWTYPPWRGAFYPAGLPHSQELAYASGKMSAIEINATFYGRQKPESFAKWRETTPEGFIFAVKASRFTTHKKDLAAAGDSVQAFLVSGISELGPKLGPVLWQFPPTRRFEREAFAAFLGFLPRQQDGIRLRHVIETRHESFADPAYIELLRDHNVAHAIVESDKQPLLADLTADFIYARLEHNRAGEPEGYATPALDGWARRVKSWAAGKAADDLPRAGAPATAVPREAFIFFIAGDKERAPDAAMAFRGRVG
jgi:uncharacterized protein YecE (DUF72 family)